jgi:hypothetical protein
MPLSAGTCAVLGQRRSSASSSRRVARSRLARPPVLALGITTDLVVDNAPSHGHCQTVRSLDTGGRCTLRVKSARASPLLAAACWWVHRRGVHRRRRIRRPALAAEIVRDLIYPIGWRVLPMIFRETETQAQRGSAIRRFRERHAASRSFGSAGPLYPCGEDLVQVRHG